MQFGEYIKKYVGLESYGYDASDDFLFDRAVYAWLDTVNSMPYLHWAEILAVNYDTGSRRFKMFSALSDLAISGMGTNIGQTELMTRINEIFKLTMEPNIEGIPIGTAQITVRRDVDVSESCLIVAESMNKEYRVSNSVPRLREWTLSGYVSSISVMIDAPFLIKPTIQLQCLLLDTYAKSRRPVWFKTNTGAFHKVLIKNLTMTQQPEWMNGVKVDIVLKEFMPVIAHSKLADTGSADKSNEEEANS